INLQNVGGGAGIAVTGTGNLRSLTSTGGTIAFTPTGTTVNLEVPDIPGILADLNGLSTRWVSNLNGSDSTGDGSSMNPYATVMRALQDVAQHQDKPATI